MDANDNLFIYYVYEKENVMKLEVRCRHINNKTYKCFVEYTLVAPFTKNDSQRSYRLLATLAGYMVVSLTLITTARRSPLERFGLNVSC